MTSDTDVVLGHRQTRLPHEVHEAGLGFRASERRTTLVFQQCPHHGGAVCPTGALEGRSQPLLRDETSTASIFESALDQRDARGGGQVKDGSLGGGYCESSTNGYVGRAKAALMSADPGPPSPATEFQGHVDGLVILRRKCPDKGGRPMAQDGVVTARQHGRRFAGQGQGGGVSYAVDASMHAMETGVCDSVHDRPFAESYLQDLASAPHAVLQISESGEGHVASQARLENVGSKRFGGNPPTLTLLYRDNVVSWRRDEQISTFS